MKNDWHREKRGSLGVAITLLCLSACLSIAQESGDVDPVPGRITGWGFIGLNKRVEETLPTGWDAENVIEVCAGTSSWAAMKSDGTVISSREIPSWISTVRDIDCGGGATIVALPDGKVVVWGSVKATLKEDASGLENVVAVEAGFRHALALRDDGTVAFWGPAYDPGEDPAKQEAAGKLVEFLDRELKDVVAINARQSTASALRGDGSAIAWMLNGYFLMSEDWAKAGTVVDVKTGSDGPCVAISPAGIALDVFTRNSEKVPTDLGPVDWVRGSLGGYSMARLRDGSFRSWGDDKLTRFETDPLRFKNLIGLEFGGSYDSRSKASFVIGIEPSYVQGFSAVSSELEPLRELLSALEAERIAASDEMIAFENRYLEELTILEESAREGNHPKISAKIVEEKENFRDLSRTPYSQPEPLVRLQEIYRTQVSEFEERRRMDELAVYGKALEQLQELQDHLTREKDLGGAVEVRVEKDKLQSAYEILQKTPGSISPAGQPLAEVTSFEAITNEQKIFSINDPRVAGQLVVAGTIGGHALTIHDSADARRVMAVEAGTDKWYALRPNGTAFGGNVSESLDLSGDMPRLDRIRDVGHNVFGYDTKGRLYLSEEAAELFTPPFPVEKLVSFEPRPIPHNFFIALLDDGSVRSWGPAYEREKFTWQVPPEVSALRDVTQIAASFEGMAAVRKNGSIILWGAETTATTSEVDPAGIAKIVASGSVFIVLRRDGTVFTLRQDNGSNAVEAVPAGLNSVVDIAGAPGLGLALRADGSWIGWGDNSDGLIDELDTIHGVRWVSVGGRSGERFLVGIRPDPEDLEK